MVWSSSRRSRIAIGPTTKFQIEDRDEEVEREVETEADTKRQKLWVMAQVQTGLELHVEEVFINLPMLTNNGIDAVEAAGHPRRRRSVAAPAASQCLNVASFWQPWLALHDFVPESGHCVVTNTSSNRKLPSSQHRRQLPTEPRS